jgi:hypothetical protein
LALIVVSVPPVLIIAMVGLVLIMFYLREMIFFVFVVAHK